MLAPPHVVQTLADIDALRARLNDTERTLRTIYALPEASEDPSPAPPVDTLPVSPARVARTERSRKGATPAAVETPDVRQTAGGKYDEGILRYLRSEAAQYGASLMDVARSFTGPGKPAEAQKLTSAMFSALASLVKRGLVRKDGRHYIIVRAHEHDEVIS